MHTSRLIETFCDLVRIDSPTGEERACSDFVRARLAALGIDVHQDERANLVAATEGVGEPLLLAAHLDTVEPGRGIKPVIEDGFVKSDGTTILGADDKAAVALLLELARWIREEKPPVRPLDLLFSVSEEAGTSGIDTLDFSRIRAKEGLTIDAAQPVGTAILGSPYYVRLEMLIAGEPADASTAERGRSVLPALAEFLSRVPKGKPYPETFCNIGILKGGQAINAVMADVRLSGEIRSFSKDALSAYVAETKNLLETISGAHGCTAIFQDFWENDGYVFTPDEPFVSTIAAAFRSADPDVLFSPVPRYWGVSDANNLNRQGIRTMNVAYGGIDPHTTRERVAIDDLETMLAFLKELVRPR